MSYHFSKKLVDAEFDEVIERVTAALKEEGFGVLTEIDVKATFKKKLDVDFRNYRILGACSPKFAHQAIQAEGHIGVFLPCNVVVQQREGGVTEVSAVDPVASMMSVENESLGALALEVQGKMKRVVESL